MMRSRQNRRTTRWFIPLAAITVGIWGCGEPRPLSETTVVNAAKQPAWSSGDHVQYRPECLYPPDVNQWVRDRYEVARAIRWQASNRHSTGHRVSPRDKRAHRSWTTAQKGDLDQVFKRFWRCYLDCEPCYATTTEEADYPPRNLARNAAPGGTGAAWTYIDGHYAWNLYVEKVAFSLFIEIAGVVPWSIENYTGSQLQALFDSSYFMLLKIGDDNEFVVGTPTQTDRRYGTAWDNRSSVVPAPPRRIFQFIQDNQLVGSSKLETITNLLDWSGVNLSHFIGKLRYEDTIINGHPSYGTETHWGYRGLPPMMYIIDGTTLDVPEPPTWTDDGFAHWTAGCSGTGGFVRDILRTVNIPVLHLVQCGHGQLYFMTENKFLDHNDNPYNTAFRALGLSAEELLIDSAKFSQWFGNWGINTHLNESHCADKVGGRIGELIDQSQN